MAKPSALSFLGGIQAVKIISFFGSVRFFLGNFRQFPDRYSGRVVSRLNINDKIFIAMPAALNLSVCRFKIDQGFAVWADGFHF
ncbi:hypothetical protein C4588_06245 [Candidatus Parcubacteria bacterium]|nr:MAG: hypothetical protein C4588_06245 [Candidatus Parcubacteria bacterium]